MYLEKLNLVGRTALVLGAGGQGMGTETSIALAEAGARIVAVDRTTELAEEAAQMVRCQGGECLPIAADLRDMQAVERAIAMAIEEAGPIQHLVNIAGGMQAAQWFRLDEYPDLAWDDVMNLNLRYVFTACRAIAAHMVVESVPGSIVNFASVSGLAGAPYHGVYGAAKAAVMALTRTMAVEWGQFDIRVNAVVPGAVNTARAQQGSPGEPEELAASWFPLPHTIEADAVPAAALFLLSDLAARITGQCLVVDAGVTARSPLGAADQYEARREESRKAFGSE
jgi:NAD(P)-dependent dehydrogenase (short-subunit alcohol dehydrogenase family)